MMGLCDATMVVVVVNVRQTVADAPIRLMTQQADIRTTLITTTALTTTTTTTTTTTAAAASTTTMETITSTTKMETITVTMGATDQGEVRVFAAQMF